MKRTCAILIAALTLGTTGCYTSRGNAAYPSSQISENLAFDHDAPRITLTSSNRPPIAMTASPAELLAQKVEAQFPAKILIVNLNAGDPLMSALVQDSLTNALRQVPHLADVEWVSSASLPKWNEYQRPNLSEIQEWAARFQARYVLITRYDFNYASKVYWMPAAITACSLGLIPMPVGGEQSFCTMEYVLMDVSSGVFVLNAQGQGHAQRTAVWGFVFNTGTPRAIDEKSLRDAIDQATPRLRDALVRFHH